jgi:hypothetical protein
MDTDTLVFPRQGPQPPDSAGTARGEPAPTAAGPLAGPAPNHCAPFSPESHENTAEDRSPPGPAAEDPSPAAVHPAPEPAVPVAPVAPTSEAALSPLEQRVCRLEQAVAELQELRGVRPAEPPGGPACGPAPVPNASPFPSPTAILVDVPRRMIGAMVGAAHELPRPAAPAAPPRPQRRWLLFDALAEARAIVRMFLDPRYHLPWPARVLPLVLLAAILTSSWLPFMGIPVVGGLLNKVIDLVLAFLLFKVLGHEARRYRETAPDLPPTLRL